VLLGGRLYTARRRAQARVQTAEEVQVRSSGKPIFCFIFIMHGDTYIPGRYKFFLNVLLLLLFSAHFFFFFALHVASTTQFTFV
jgi:hypothetical protein